MCMDKIYRLHVCEYIGTDLEKHFNGKESCKYVVEVGEDVVPLAVLLHGVLGGQRNAAQDDDDHDERLEAGNSDDAVNENANPVKSKCKKYLDFALKKWANQFPLTQGSNLCFNKGLVSLLILGTMNLKTRVIHYGNYS